MILASWNAIPKKKLSEFLKGPAKVYDGAFDYDIVHNFIHPHSDFSVLVTLDLKFQLSLSKILFSARTSANESGYVVVIATGGNFIRSNYQINNVNYASNSIPFQEGKSVLIFNVSTSENSIYLNGVKINDTEVTPPNYIDQITDLVIGNGKNNVNNRYLDSSIKQLEIINRVATAQEIADASNPITGGSFRSAGIAHNSGEYLFALNTNQTDGNPPTTFPDTPFYNITSFGGAQYVPYQSL